MSVKNVQAIINGQTYTLSLNSQTGMWEATITSPGKSSYTQDGHYYNVALNATDDAGNISSIDANDLSLGTNLQLKVKEKVVPVIAVTSPTASSRLTNNKPVITWTCTDDDSGIDESTIKITIDSQSAITSGITKTQIVGGYQCSYTPSAALSDGSHTVKFDVSDNDGNVAVQKSVSFTVDTIAPTMSVSSPEDGLITNNKTITVSGSTNDATSSPVTVKIKVNTGAEQTVDVSNGSFSKQIELSAGVNTITVTATDAAGKTTTITRTVTLDTGAPIFRSVRISPNPVDAGTTFIISVEVVD